MSACALTQLDPQSTNGGATPATLAKLRLAIVGDRMRRLGCNLQHQVGAMPPPGRYHPQGKAHHWRTDRARPLCSRPWKTCATRTRAELVAMRPRMPLIVKMTQTWPKVRHQLTSKNCPKPLKLVSQSGEISLNLVTLKAFYISSATTVAELFLAHVWCHKYLLISKLCRQFKTNEDI